jgi:enediyne polyketide synthase
MGCVFPGAHSPEELWQNVLAGRRFFRRAPPERLPPADYCDPDPEAPGKSYCEQLALITGWVFDPFEFRIPPVVEEASDIAHWLALWTAQRAVQDARLNLRALDRSRVGAILGNTLAGEFSRSNTLRLRWPYVERAIRLALGAGTTSAMTDSLVTAVRRVYEAPLPEITEDSLAGNMSNTIVGRICNHFDLGGGGYTVDGACSSSLLAVAHACEALQRGELDLALAGGVDVSLDPFEIVGFAKARALAADDIRPYDESAAGMLAGEGCGIFVLAREQDARARGWRVRALIRGWGISSDGHGGITAPEVEGQARALRKAYERAGYPISSVGLFEGHGTGTALGDRVEVAALRSLIDDAPDHGTCWIGSIKGSIGHCKAAAGSAGLVKAILALERKVIPPTASCRVPHAVFGRPIGRLRPALEGQAWTGGGVPRRASVSSMGFGGANSHVTLEEASPEATASVEDLALLGSSRETELILFSANDAGQLAREAARLAGIAGRISRAELTDMAAALADAAPRGPCRAAVVADSPWGLEAALADLAERLQGWPGSGTIHDPEGRFAAGAARSGARLAMLFPGQASQRINMGAFLHRRFPFVRDLFRDADRAVADLVPEGLTANIFVDQHATDEEARQRHLARLRETRFAQPAIVLCSVAALQVLEHFGLRPDVALGHSLGEITALHAMGAFDEMTAVRIAALRGLAMASLDVADAGAMAAVQAPPERVNEMIRPLGPTIAVANYNSPRQTVVSGASEAVRNLVARCRAAGVVCTVLPVSHAFHSEIVAPAAATFRRRLDGVVFHPLRGTVVSTALGERLDAGTDLAALLADQIRLPVRLTDAASRAAREAPDLWVEAGPGDVLCRLVTETLGEDRARCLPADPAGEDGSRALNRILGRAFVLGLPVAVGKLNDYRFRRPFPLEEYRPVFITNPCERPFEAASLGIAAPALSGAADLAPPEATPEDFQAYLEQRLAFIREFVAMDFRSRPAAPRPAPAGAPVAPVPAAAAAAAEPPPAAGEEAILDFAAGWIARRTGYPVSAVLPNMRLRDDLNLDSIKAGELTVVLARRFKGEFGGDPARLANTSLQELARAFRPSLPEGVAAATGDRADELPPRSNIPDSVRTFRTESRPFPLDEEGAGDPLPADGSALVVADQGCTRADSVVAALAARGLAPTLLEPGFVNAGEHLPADLRAIVLLLPSQGGDFLSCTPEEFDRRVDGLFARLFGLFRWVLSARPSGLAGLRVVVARPECARGSDADLDAGGGFLRSLQLEQPEGRLTWVSLPEAWPAGRWADTVLRELENNGRRVVYRYTLDGVRTGEVALPLDAPGSAAAPLGPEDTVLATGGAKGITFELALALAQRLRVRLALLGSSPPPAPGGAAGDEMARNFTRLAEAGVRFHYQQCDVTDRAAVREALRLAELQLGPVTAMLHGAGVSSLRLLREADARTSARAVRVKARGLYNLLAEVPPARLKAVHVLSSVLGTTGMKGQTDYTFANAWLNGALRSLEAAHPHLHCLALGYSVWSETGLGKKLGAVESLVSLGITPIGTRDGVAAYLRLLERPRAGSTCLIAGRMTPELEEFLFGRPQIPRGRFLERVLRWIPGGEVVASATLSDGEDRYLPEHVFRDTVIFPGVMALEAMVEAAQACTGSGDLPVLRSVRFTRPLVVPPGERVAVRVMAVADPPVDGRTKVKVAVRSEADGFRENHFRADCWFGLPPSGEAAFAPTAVPGPLPIDPESYSPWPLFQGKFFRRITAIRRLDAPREAVTEIAVPEGERYFQGGAGQPLTTGSAAARDSFLQSGALLLPPGYLPSGVGEVRFHAPLPAGEPVFCRVWGSAGPEGAYTAEIAVHAGDGRLLETMRGIRLEATAALPKEMTRAAAPRPTGSLEAEVSSLLDVSVALVVVRHDEVEGALARGEITAAERREAAGRYSERRLPTALANVLAAKRAGRRFLERRGLAVDAVDHAGLVLTHLADGKPELRLADGAPLPAEADVNLTDSEGLSMALVGPRRVGIDLEPVAARDAETWIGLLGDGGYRQARDLVTQTGEPFDRIATRVWTLTEARRKAGVRGAVAPGAPDRVDGPWIRIGPATPGGLQMLSGVLADGEGPIFALAIAAPQGARETVPPATAPRPRTAGERVDRIVAEFFARLQEAGEAFRDDPDSPETESHHRLFRDVIEDVLARLRAEEPFLEAGELKEKRKGVYAGLRPHIQGSAAFRRTLEKPLGYPGDHLLMDLIFRRDLRTRGLGYHFDRIFLDYPGCEAIRQRSLWVVERVRALLAERGAGRIALLDLGCGPMAIERTLVETAGEGAFFTITGMDFDAKALEFASSQVQGPRVRLQTSRQNLLSPEGVAAARAAAAEADACICMGLIEYLGDEAAGAIYEALAQGAQPGTALLTSNYRPGHHAVPTMEWFLDWWLVYRTESGLARLVESAGFPAAGIRTRMDATGSIVLLEARR